MKLSKIYVLDLPQEGLARELHMFFQIYRWGNHKSKANQIARHALGERCRKII